MLTAIYVYQTTPIDISTHENNLQLCRMNANVVPLSMAGKPWVPDPGIYKITSSENLEIAGDRSAFDVITTSAKNNDPKPPPIRASTMFAPLDESALQAFLVDPEAKHVLNP